MYKISRMLMLIALITFSIGTSYCDNEKKTSEKQTNQKRGTDDMIIQSRAFNEGETIPVKYTCDGEDVSVPLAWSNAPENTKSFALICDDPDAPGGTWVHWVVINIPPNTTALEEGVNLKGDSLFTGTIECHNDFGKVAYGGPCPPPGPVHRYYFKLYALDTMLNLSSDMEKAEVEEEMSGHLLAQAALMGKYGR